MQTITIPKTFSREDLIVIPRREYEKLVNFQKVAEFDPTPAQKKALAKAEKNLLHGKSFSYDDLVKKLGFKN